MKADATGGAGQENRQDRRDRPLARALAVGPLVRADEYCILGGVAPALQSATQRPRNSVDSATPGGENAVTANRR